MSMSDSDQDREDELGALDLKAYSILKTKWTIDAAKQWTAEEAAAKPGEDAQGFLKACAAKFMKIYGKQSKGYTRSVWFKGFLDCFPFTPYFAFCEQAKSKYKISEDVWYLKFATFLDSVKRRKTEEPGNFMPPLSGPAAILPAQLPHVDEAATAAATRAVLDGVVARVLLLEQMVAEHTATFATLNAQFGGYEKAAVADLVWQKKKAERHKAAAKKPIKVCLCADWYWLVLVEKVKKCQCQSLLVIGSQYVLAL
jgi:hypothetical protein